MHENRDRVQAVRVDKATGVILNIENPSREWLDAQPDDGPYRFVEYLTDFGPQPRIGLHYSPETGFEQEPKPEGWQE